MNNDEMRTIEISHVKVSATPGISIGDAIRDAIVLSVNEWRNVRLNHNGKEYLVSPNDIFSTVKENKNNE